MRRATAGLIGLLLVGAAAVALATVSIARAAPVSEGCAWHRHSKPLVKHLKRHGRLRRIRRVRHWWSCDGEPVATPDPTVSVLPPAGPPVFDESEPSVSHLSVKAVEYSYTLSRPEVSSGDVIVELNNAGDDPHNLKLKREGSEESPLEVPEAAAATQTTARFSLAPGTYRLYCSLFQHEEKGMHAILVVGGA